MKFHERNKDGHYCWVTELMVWYKLEEGGPASIQILIGAARRILKTIDKLRERRRHWARRELVRLNETLPYFVGVIWRLFICPINLQTCYFHNKQTTIIG